jgi:hypothetical protein
MAASRHFYPNAVESIEMLLIKGVNLIHIVLDHPCCVISINGIWQSFGNNFGRVLYFHQELSDGVRSVAPMYKIQGRVTVREAVRMDRFVPVRVNPAISSAILAMVMMSREYRI